MTVAAAPPKKKPARVRKVSHVADTPYQRQQRYLEAKRQAGEVVQLGVSLKKEEDVELWLEVLRLCPGWTRVDVVREGLKLLLASLKKARPS